MDTELLREFDILIIEDNQGDVALVEAYLQESTQYRFNLSYASTLKEGQDILSKQGANVILLDMGLPDSAGLEALQKLLEHHPKACIVVLTGNENGSLGQMSVTKGAQDYLLKDELNRRNLEKAIVFAHERASLKSQMIEKDQELSRLSAAVDQAPISVELTDVNSKITYVNPRVIELTGYSKEELIGSDASIFQSGRHNREFYQNIFETVNKGDTWYGVFINKFKDGKEYYEQSSISPVYDQNGELINYLSIKQDITEQLIIEKRLKNKAHILDSIQDAIITLNRQGQVDYWNFAAEKLFGFTAAEAKGQTLLALNVCEGTPEEISKFVKSLMQNKTLHTELTLKNKNGRKFPSRINASLLYDEQNLSVGILGICSDITEEQKLQDRVDETSRHYANLISNMPGLVYRCDYSKQLTITFISRGCEELTGYTPDDFKADEGLMMKIIHEDNREERWHNLRSVDTTEGKYSMIYRIITKSGKPKWVMEKGTVFGSLGSGTLEGVMYDYTDSVDYRAELMNTVMSTEMNERSRISKEIHDGLQQTLTSAFLNFEGIKPQITTFDQDTIKRFQTAFELLQKSIQESRGIAHRLLPKVIEDFSLLEALESLISGMGKLPFELNFGHNLDTHIELGKNIELVIYRVVQESLTNIIKYAHAQRVDLQIFNYPDEVILTIEDDGIGFDITTAKEHSFGLMTMKSRASAIDGFLQVDSRPGRGTNIMLEIPLRENLGISHSYTND